MKTLLSALLSIVTPLSIAGCGEAESSARRNTMDQMAARLDRPAGGSETAAVPGDASGSVPADSSSAGTSPRERAQPPLPAGAPSADSSLAFRRGFALKDWSNEAAYVLVKKDAAHVAEALAKHFSGQVVKDVFGKPLDAERAGFIVYQLAGHPWSVFATDPSALERLGEATAFSHELGADILLFWNSDFNGWAGLELYRAGEEVEAVHWGGVDEKLGEDADASRWQVEGQFTRNHDGISFTDAFLFRSKLRKTTKAELDKGEAFVDAMMRHHDAYLPDMDEMPWLGEGEVVESPLGRAAFSAVHVVQINVQ